MRVGVLREDPPPGGAADPRGVFGIEPLDLLRHLGAIVRGWLGV